MSSIVAACAGSARALAACPCSWRTRSSRSAASPASSTPKPAGRPERARVQADQPVARPSGTCRRRPRPAFGRDALGQRARPLDHLARRPAGEGQQQDPLGRHALARPATRPARTASSSCPCPRRRGSAAGRRVRRRRPLLVVEAARRRIGDSRLRGEHVFDHSDRPPGRKRRRRRARGSLPFAHGRGRKPAHRHGAVRRRRRLDGDRRAARARALEVPLRRGQSR